MKLPITLNGLTQGKFPSTPDQISDLANDNMDTGYCLGFLDGLSSGLYLQTGKLVAICLPDQGAKIRDLWAAFTSYVLAHPEDSQQGASVIAGRALVERYPCPSK